MNAERALAAIADFAAELVDCPVPTLVYGRIEANERHRIGKHILELIEGSE